MGRIWTNAIEADNEEVGIDVAVYDGAYLRRDKAVADEEETWARGGLVASGIRKRGQEEDYLGEHQKLRGQEMHDLGEIDLRASLDLCCKV